MRRRSIALDKRSHIRLTALSRSPGIGWSAVVRLAVEHLGQQHGAAKPEQREQLRVVGIGNTSALSRIRGRSL